MISFTKSSLSKSMQSWIPPTGWCWSFSTSSVYILWLTTVMIIITIPQWILLTVSALSKIYGWIKLPLATKCIHQPARDEADSTRSRWRSRTDRLLRLFSMSRRPMIINHHTELIGNILDSMKHLLSLPTPSSTTTVGTTGVLITVATLARHCRQAAALHRCAARNLRIEKIK